MYLLALFYYGYNSYKKARKKFKKTHLIDHLGLLLKKYGAKN